MVWKNSKLKSAITKIIPTPTPDPVKMDESKKDEEHFLNNTYKIEESENKDVIMNNFSDKHLKKLEFITPNPDHSEFNQNIQSLSSIDDKSEKYFEQERKERYMYYYFFRSENQLFFVF